VSTQHELAVSYGVSNDFFRLWLDRGMNYSCGLFFDADDSLEQAQENKLDYFFRGTRLNASSRVLDIGCGWGGNLAFLTRKRRLPDVVGITLAKEQYLHLRQELSDVEVHCVSYRDYEPDRPFDALISIGMFEHIATPEQVRSHEHIAAYRDYFRRAHGWTRSGAYFGLQSVVGARIPRDREVLRELGWATRRIFPGAISPRIEAIVASLSAYWEIVELRTRRRHYERTTQEWLRRLEASERVIRERWGDRTFDEYQRYLRGCVRFFEEGYQSLAQLILRRVD
jgi:cyclopropane-fatty-acyl-phospholipid synthase